MGRIDSGGDAEIEWAGKGVRKWYGSGGRVDIEKTIEGARGGKRVQILLKKHWRKGDLLSLITWKVPVGSPSCLTPTVQQ